MDASALAYLLTAFIYKRNLRGVDLGLGKFKYYVIAYFLPFLYASVAYGLGWRCRASRRREQRFASQDLESVQGAKDRDAQRQRDLHIRSPVPFPMSNVAVPDTHGTRSGGDYATD